MRAELFARDDAASFVQAFDIPPFIVPPGVIVWGSRTFTASGAPAHMHNCAHITQAPTPPCNCGGVAAYQETMAYTALDMQAVAASKSPYQPISRKP